MLRGSTPVPVSMSRHAPSFGAQARVEQEAEKFRRINIPAAGVVRRGASPVEGTLVVDRAALHLAFPRPFDFIGGSCVQKFLEARVIDGGGIGLP